MVIKSAPLTDLLRIFSRRFVEDRCDMTASSLTFTALLALVPIITIALTVASAFPVFDSLIGHLRSFVMNNMLPESVNAISTYTEKFSENTAQLTAVGIAFLGVTALLLMLTIDHAFNNIWRVSRPRPLLQRVRAGQSQPVPGSDFFDAHRRQHADVARAVVRPAGAGRRCRYRGHPHQGGVTAVFSRGRRAPDISSCWSTRAPP